MDLNDTNSGNTGASSSDAAAALLGGAGAIAGGVAGGDGAGSSDTGAGADGSSDSGAGDIGAAAEPDWYANLSVDASADAVSNRDWIKAKNFKDLDGLTKALRSAEKAIHDSGRVKVPGEGASAEDVAVFHKAIGVPDDPAGYKLPQINDADGNPVALNTEKLNNIAAIAHKNGIPAAALEATLQQIAEADAQEFSMQESDIQRRASDHAKKWGPKAAENTAAIGRAVEALGLEREETLAIRAAIGPERALDIFAKLGAGLSEDTMVQGGGKQKFGLSGAEAQKQFDTKKQNPAWVEKAMIPGTAERAEYDRLNAAVGDAADRARRENA